MPDTKNLISTWSTGGTDNFRQLFEGHGAAMLIIDPHKKMIVEANPAAAQFYGYPLETLRGMNVSRINILSENEIDVLRQQALQEGKKHYIIDHRLASGVIRTVETYISTILIDAVPHFFTIIHDITDRVQAETELRIAAIAFETQEGIMITDSAMTILRVNRAFTAITGYSAKEAVGNTPRLIHSGHHDVAFYKNMWASIHVNGSWQGEVLNRRKTGEIYPEHLMITSVKNTSGEVTHYVGTFTDITLRKTVEEKIRTMAYYDPLTELPNRRMLDDRLDKAMASSRRNGHFLGLMFLDLDNFKSLNDTHGHEWGDLLLVELAQRLKKCVRETDTVARLGGDEFVVLLTDLSTDESEATESTRLVAEKIRSSVSQPYQLSVKPSDGGITALTYHCTASIGVTMFVGTTGSQEDVLRQSDAAMYDAKEAGRNTIRFAILNSQRQDMAHGIYKGLVRLSWHFAYECGQSDIDEQHRALFSHANNIVAALLSGRSASEIRLLVDVLIQDVVYHFNYEEKILREAGYPNVKEHAAIHHALIARAHQLDNSSQSGPLALGDLFQFLIQDLVAKHMLGEDRKFFHFLQGHGAKSRDSSAITTDEQKS